MAIKKERKKGIGMLYEIARRVLESMSTGLSAFKKIFKKNEKENTWFTSLSNRVGIDLGTATTVVYVEKKGVVLLEPTLIAVNKKTNQVIAVGKKARTMVGRTPEHIEVVQPVQQGVIFDYEVTEQLFAYIFRKIQDTSPKILGPIVIVGVPCCTSQTEINAVRDSVIDAGARQVHIVYEPLAAAIGLGVSLENETSFMVIDIGGGTSDTMILVGGEIVANDSIRIAGDTFDIAIMKGLQEQRQLIVGRRTAEDLKIAIMQSANEQKTFSVQGRNAINGLPLEVEVTVNEVLTFISEPIDEVVQHLNSFIEKVSPEVLSDLQNNNIYFVGGGPSIQSFADKIEEAINIKIIVPENPTTLVARGTAIIAQNPEKHKNFFL